MSYIKAPPPAYRYTSGGASGYIKVEKPWGVPYATRYRCSDGAIRTYVGPYNIDVDDTLTYTDANDYEYGGVTTATGTQVMFYIYLIPKDDDTSVLVPIAATDTPDDGGPQATGYSGLPWYYVGAFQTDASSNPMAVKASGGWTWLHQSQYLPFRYYANVDPGHTLNSWAQIADLHAKPYNSYGCPETATWIHIAVKTSNTQRWYWAQKTYPIAPTTALDTPTRKQGYYTNHSCHQFMLHDSSGYSVYWAGHAEYAVTPGNAKLYGYSWYQVSTYMHFNTLGWRDGYVGVG